MNEKKTLFSTQTLYTIPNWALVVCMSKYICKRFIKLEILLQSQFLYNVGNLEIHCTFLHSRYVHLVYGLLSLL